MSVTLEGLTRTLQTLGNIPEEAKVVVRQEVLRGTVDVHREAKENLSAMVYQQPENPGYTRTGRLMNDVAFSIENDGLTGRVGNSVFYARYVHHGTRFMRERPYLFLAFEAVMPRFMARLGSRLPVGLAALRRG